MPGDRVFDPSNSLRIRDPQDNGSPSDKIRNPPRYMELGGIESGNSRGFGKNDMAIRMPGSTISKVPVQKNRNMG
jgi:hypothetical protein